MKKAKRYFSAVVLLSVISLAGENNVFSQERGHFIAGANTSYLFGGGKADNPSNLMYSLEAGIAYDVHEHVRITGGFGGFRSVMSFYDQGRRMEILNGPMAWVGAEYVFNPIGKVFHPVISLGLGYRFFVPSSMEEPSYPKFGQGLFDGDVMLENTEEHIWKYLPYVNREGLNARNTLQSGTEGVFLRGGIGTDIIMGNLCLNVSFFGELTEFYTGGFAMDSGKRYGRSVKLHNVNGDKEPIDEGIDVYTDGKAPFLQRLRVLVGFSIKVML